MRPHTKKINHFINIRDNRYEYINHIRVTKDRSINRGANFSHRARSSISTFRTSSGEKLQKERAEKATPGKRAVGSEYKHPHELRSSAGSRAGGGGGDGAAVPPPSPRPELPYFPPRSPLPADYQDFDDFDDELLDEDERNGDGSLFLSDLQNLSKFLSDPPDLPYFIGRQNCEPLITVDYFSLHHNWQQLLDGKRTYLRPPNDNLLLEYNDDFPFEIPEPLQRALGCQEPLSVLLREAAKNSIIQQKLKILREHHVYIRQMRIDGSCFYRAFLFSYLENLGQMQGSQAEVTRLMKCVAKSRKNFCRLQWNNAYFSDPEAFFSSVVSEFEHLVNSVANGLSADELYKRSLQEITSSRKVHIRTHEEEYKPMLRQQTSALLFCTEKVRPFGAEAGFLQMRALSFELGIPLHVAHVDTTVSSNGTAQVMCFDFFTRSGSRESTSSGALGSTRRYHLSSITDKRNSSNSVMPAGSLLSSGRMPLVTLLSRNGQCDILYRK